MTLGDVLKKERSRRSLSVAETAGALQVGAEKYQAIEGGASPAEQWGPLLGRIAIALETPTSRLISPSGKPNGVNSGQCGNLIRERRNQLGKSAAEMSGVLKITADEYQAIEDGVSPIEEYGPLLLRFADRVELPIFNLIYPCGLPLEEVTAYP